MRLDPVLLLTVSATVPAAPPTVTRIVVIHPALVQQSIPSIPSPLFEPENTKISLAAACLTSVIAARCRGARVMYSVSIVSFGAEFGRPLMCLMLNKTQQYQTLSIHMLRHHVSGTSCATDLFDPEPDVLGFHLFDGRANPRTATSIQIRARASSPSSRIVLANQIASIAHRTRLYSSQANAMPRRSGARNVSLANTLW